MTASWHALLAPLPEAAMVERRAVASAEQIANGTAGPIAGWESLSVHLSDVGVGLRHVLVTIDADGRLLSAGDGVLFQRTEQRDGVAVAVYDHDNIGGRFEDDGTFNGTCWKTRSEQVGEEGEPVIVSSTPSVPTPEDVAALTRLVAEVMRRAAGER